MHSALLKKRTDGWRARIAEEFQPVGSNGDKTMLPTFAKLRKWGTKAAGPSRTAPVRRVPGITGALSALPLEATDLLGFKLSMQTSILKKASGSLFLAAVAVLSMLGSAPLRAAEPSRTYALTRGTNEFGLWIGGSPYSFGNTHDRQLLLVGLRYGRVLAEWDWGALQYNLDIIPAAVVFEPSRVRRGSSTIYGAGLSPLGLKLSLGQSWIKPFLAGNVGFLYFQHSIPVPRSSHFNFTPEIGLGVDFFLTPKQALTLGYKVHHISNAGLGDNNPGMDSHVIYAGFSFFTP